jgi:hypothetical protein
MIEQLVHTLTWLPEATTVLKFITALLAAMWTAVLSWLRLRRWWRNRRRR